MKIIALLLLGCGDTEPPAPPLVRLDPEPAGAQCAAGGVAMHAGRDTDGSGVLDDAEIDDTEFVCHGSDGEPGIDGEPGAEGQPGEDGAPGLGGLFMGTPTRLDDGSNPAVLSGLADTDGILVVDLGATSGPARRITLGPDADNLERYCYECSTVPVPAGWAWQVEVDNHNWADLAVWWTALEPAE